jgi:ssDNA-binding Zn-finger/Zn-ribbon topoisomerase 1
MNIENQLQTKNVRCKQCNYILDDLPFKRCNGCGECFHIHCLDQNKGKVMKAQRRDDNEHTWSCSNCRTCSYCLSGKNREALVISFLRQINLDVVPIM